MVRTSLDRTWTLAGLVGPFRTWTFAGLVGLSAVTLAACGPAPPTVDCATVTVPKYSELTIVPLCTSCHASVARPSAPAGVTLDSYAAAVAHATSSAAQVNGGLMPPSDAAQPTEAQKAALYAWAMCGTPN
jgi:uncharacterized membrane protein